MIDSSSARGEGGSKTKLVGAFIRKRRESLGLSQRALGQLFEPPVTTQFISNVERGVTPLPPAHVPILAKALSVAEDELMSVLEREYAVKLSGRIGLDRGALAEATAHANQIVVSPQDAALMRGIYDAYKRASEENRKAFRTVCETILGLKLETVNADDDDSVPSA